jgi:hypothetical protein
MSLVNPGALPYEPIETFPPWAEKSSLVASILRWIAWSFFGVLSHFCGSRSGSAHNSASRRRSSSR